MKERNECWWSGVLVRRSEEMRSVCGMKFYAVKILKNYILKSQGVKKVPAYWCVVCAGVKRSKVGVSQLTGICIRGNFRFHFSN